MIRIAKISLDIHKDAVINNKPIILRQGESDVIIEATISNGGYENLQINFATFVAKKPDGTIISNDPANVNGNVIDYPISKHLTESVGKIQDAYFMINNQVTTCGFDISIIPSAQLDDTSVNYIPGIENINKFLESAEADWLGRIQQMKAQIDGLNIPDEFKLLMDKALSDAKDQYQPIIDSAEENVESIAADLAAKKLDLENNSDELNATIAAIKAQIAPVNSFLDGVQKQIIAANASFTADQQAKVSQSIADGQKKLTDSIASMQSEVTQTIADLKNSSNAAIKDMQENQSTAMAKVSQDITGLKAQLDALEVPEIGGRNLIIRNGEILDTIVGTDGKINTFQGSSLMKDYIDVTSVKKLTFQIWGSYGNPGQAPDNNIRFACYDNSNNLISRQLLSSYPTTLSVPNNAAKIQISYPTLMKVKVEAGNVPTDWTPAPEDKVNVSDTANWQKQKITQDGAFYYATCPSRTDFGEFLKSDSVPLGLSIIRDQNTKWNWRIEKESSDYIFGLSQDIGGTVYHLEVSNGAYQGYKKVISNLMGQTITATDDTGKTVKLKITGIS